ncbi:hypothetical protein MSAN_01141400 [Mycena sanguinolenta]|uniref:Uncharacterized protein n=1 Tax=Mycena sanguinolenta TaxID=230812 RepID=A0A8H6YNH4_9AGAR|nr:hypothetical protein MSAN_01141400 [Mycena sanguinolenta]
MGKGKVETLQARTQTKIHSEVAAQVADHMVKEQIKLSKLHAVPDEDEEWEDDNNFTLNDILDGTTFSDPEEQSACEEHWKNLSEELTAKMWGIFEKMGIFLALCCHGFVLLVADMVRSGELAKYPLAIENSLLDVFGPNIGLGYDVGCGYETTIKCSPLAAKAKALNLMMLLKYLAMYVNGLGIEDLEGLQAAVLQTIRTYLAHLDTFETYPNLSIFLVNNYKQAIEIINGELALKLAMGKMGVTKEELEGEMDQMNYYQELVNLFDQRYNTAAAALQPPGRALSWAEVVDYTFLSDFDLLRDPAGNVAVRKWVEPANRQLLDRYHKINQAREEIVCLNVEIRRFVTYMRDEHSFLVKKEQEKTAADPMLAFFIRRYRYRCGCFDDVHLKRLKTMKKKLGPQFTGMLSLGVHAPSSVVPFADDTLHLESDGDPEPEGNQMDIDDEGAEDDDGSEDDWLAEDGSEDGREYANREELAAAIEGVALVAIDREDCLQGDAALMEVARTFD